MIPERKALRVCKVSLKIPFFFFFFGVNTIKEKRIVQIIPCPFTCWEPLAARHQTGLQPGHGADPIHGKVTPFWSFEILSVFLKRKQFY